MADAGHSSERAAGARADGVDWCDDTGRNNRLASPGFVDTWVLVVLADCTVPHGEFRVTG
ncbi:hypothetical protein [Paeniglutamicibacter sp. Y32M11]|uniref:hypothetical protein n=1 Tax=Paeniglutamicibacter sp. Y32M11 TaxID=2853258 RepID=UPI001C532A11|nr:hypothetical protein [Paeniglutamicibacter sp. Y32M11]QXQ09752.1 hypothetical protein KUF55_15055 [Paeniglutamicibacter sp. Y32M11]